MPICPNCGSYVSEGSHTCSCGTSFSYNSSYEKQAEENPKEIERKKLARQYYLDGKSLQRQGRYAEALRMFERSMDLGSTLFNTYHKALLFYDMGEYEKALELFCEFMGNGEDRHMLLKIGKTLTKLGRYDEALDRFFRVIGIINGSKEFVQDYTNPNCGIYYTPEELDRKASKKQKKKRKALAKVYKEIAWAYKSQGNYNVAIKYIDEAILFDGGNAQYWNAKAIILEETRTFKKSKECYDRAIELDSHNIYIENRARMIKDWCRDSCDKSRNLKNAKKLIQSAIKDLSAIETDEDIIEYVDLRNDIKAKIQSSKDYDLLTEIGKDNLITIEGTSYYGYPNFERGMELELVREPDNEYDCDEIGVYRDGVKVGYVANIHNSACYLTAKASDLKIGDNVRAEFLMFYQFKYRIARVIKG